MLIEIHLKIVCTQTHRFIQTITVVKFMYERFLAYNLVSKGFTKEFALPVFKTHLKVHFTDIIAFLLVHSPHGTN